MIQLTRTGAVADSRDIEDLRARFRGDHYVLLPGLLAPELLGFVHSSLGNGVWEEIRNSIGVIVRLLTHCTAVELLRFVTNSPRFLEAAGQITERGPYSWFNGRVYQMPGSTRYSDEWHTDNVNGRLAALSLNLSQRKYRGGLLQLRDTGSKRILAEIANTEPGSAIIFRISENLAHRVTDVQGDEPRTAFAGWFEKTADFRSRLQDAQAELTDHRLHVRTNDSSRF